MTQALCEAHKEEGEHQRGSDRVAMLSRARGNSGGEDDELAVGMGWVAGGDEAARDSGLSRAHGRAARCREKRWWKTRSECWYMQWFILVDVENFGEGDGVVVREGHEKKRKRNRD